MVGHWGPAPATCSSTERRNPEGEIVVAAIQSGKIVILVQPPRGFGENPVAIYHDPDLPPSHHYSGPTYPCIASRVSGHMPRFILAARKPRVAARQDRRGMSADCGTDAALGDLPLIYLFLVNDPGEGTQAKRRARCRSSSTTYSADGPRRDLR